MTYDILEDCLGDKGELSGGRDQFDNFGSRLDHRFWRTDRNGCRPVNAGTSRRSTPLRII